MLRGLYFLGGAVALGLGLAGIVLPLLPTTPFLLLSSYCFVRSSPAAHRWLLSHRWFGPYLRDWELHRGVRRSVKLVAVSSVALVVLSTWVLSDSSVVLRTAVTGLAAVGLVVVWRLPVTRGEEADVPAARPAAESPIPLDLVA
ncbi:MAG: YbaN family protein [Planctomycetaceae bacterium]|nr:YbaN family protein [Planctomycetaceae bacterium]